MAEFCLDCLNKFGEPHYKRCQVIESPIPCFCEGTEKPDGKNPSGFALFSHRKSNKSEGEASSLSQNLKIISRETPTLPSSAAIDYCVFICRNSLTMDSTA